MYNCIEYLLKENENFSLNNFHLKATKFINDFVGEN